MRSSNKPIKPTNITAVEKSQSSAGRSRFRSVAMKVFDVNSDVVLVVAPSRSIIDVIPRSALSILEQTAQADHISGHIETVRQSYSLADNRLDAVRSVIDILISKKLLEPTHSSGQSSGQASFDSEDGYDADKPRSINILAIPTKGRPQILQRSLSSHLSSANYFGQEISVKVVDDSTSLAIQSHTRGSMSELARDSGTPIEYIGRRERQCFADRLARHSGVPRHLIEFGIIGDADSRAPGASRNFLLLYLVGKRFISFDDDVFSSAVIPPGFGRHLALTSVADPLETWICSSQAEIDRSFPAQQVDIIEGHRALLGQRSCSLILNACRQPGITTTRLTEVFARTIAAGVRLPVTFGGVSGDSGKWSNRYYYSFDGESFDRLVASQEKYESAIASRYALRAVVANTIGSGPYAMGPNVGFDGSYLLPPFLPQYISEDGVFGVLMRECFSAEYALGFCPFAVSHRPRGSRTTSRAQLEETSVQRRVADIVRYLIQSFDLSPGCDGKRRLVEVGERLQEISSGSARAFDQFVEEVVSSAIRNLLDRISHRVEVGDRLPPFFLEDVLSYKGALERQLRSGNVSRPVDILDSRVGSIDVLRLFVAKFAKLLIAWPSLVASARELQGDDGRFFRRL